MNKKQSRKSVRKQTRDHEYLQLPNGCYCTKPYISPANWTSPNASVKNDWYLRFTFYDPVRRPDGKKIKWEGMNSQKTWVTRYAATEQLLNDTTTRLKNGYNPIVKDFVAPPTPAVAAIFTKSAAGIVDAGEIITTETPLIKALEWAEARANWSHRTRIDIRSYMSFVYPSIRILKYDSLPLGTITYQHIDNILAQTFKITSRYNETRKKETKVNWSNYKKNRAKNYFSSYFGIMKEKKVLKDNPCSGMKDLPWKKKKEDAYSPEELQKIMRLIWTNDPDYAVFMMLFFDSGARETEFMKLKKSDVNLKNQTFKREILKGLHNRSSDDEDPEGIISNAALPYWVRVLEKCKDGDYIFSRGFRPGPKSIRPDNINKLWCKIVKPHFPNSRPYLMKHTNLTSIVDQFGDNIAAAAAGHTTTEMIKKHYDKRKNKRAHEILKTKSNLHLLTSPTDEHCGLSAESNCTVCPISIFMVSCIPRVPCFSCKVELIIPTGQHLKTLAA